MYSIVKTIEKNGPAIVAIPSIWVKDGHLYWPRDNRNLRKLRRKQAVPEETWEKLNCEIKKHGITTWDEALHLEKMLCKVETENEEDVLTRHTDQKKSFIQKNFDSSIRNIAASAVSENSSTSIVSAKKSLKRKSPEDEAHDSVEHRAKQSKLSQKSQFSVNGNLQDCDTEDHNRINLVSRDSHAEYSSDSTDTSPKAQNSPVSSFSFSDKEEISVKNANDIILAIANLTKGQARIETKLDHVTTILLRDSSGNKQQKKVTECVRKTYFPIKSSKDLCALEEKLNENDFKENVIEEFGKIHGATGEGKYKKIVYKLVDDMFDRCIFTSFSWSGKSKNNRKQNFSSLKNVFDTFYQIVNNADKAYTIHLNYEYFKRFLKYSFERVERNNKKK
ncbi:uncharacterized protein LOC129791929 [Lutzomyia longipalpis]|uniref:uncharacterized protein LOC129789064 n=1 Tax=Lutzomyia longipalpis TaxID=7200 RepID=UPI002483B0CF|nr:uncharacterized protein LOC129789064 [Lutzomyia longipalpis]XP_055682682.1 uncharacterized protein LOC129789702 [Lutzomyia longipalpis]XP_055682683.1 uncharacterized protein LOC129789703 [Lutzomyia longipalpis]XP_055686571.1 uncharacterized protein LOC129791929 [Lutzomyia longipalpis]